KSKARDVLVPGIVEALTAQPPDVVDMVGQPTPRQVVYSGTLSQIEEYFSERYWTDGLPIIPPTIDRVEEFLRFTPRREDECLGTLLPERREATIWNVAVNGVMAGCRPEYMPILVAAAEALSDPIFGLEHAGSTPSWEPLVILSGPRVE